MDPYFSPEQGVVDLQRLCGVSLPALLLPPEHLRDQFAAAGTLQAEDALDVSHDGSPPATRLLGHFTPGLYMVLYSVLLGCKIFSPKLLPSGTKSKIILGDSKVPASWGHSR